jgi:two-component system, cell cycle sensor histidine kinase and response regulator CckA
VIFSTDENGILTYISPRVTPLMGYDPSEIMGRSFTEFVHPDDLPSALGRFQEIEKGKFMPSEYRLMSKSGAYHWVRASTRPIYLADRFAGLKGLVTDITEEMQLKENLLQARKMEAISTLTGGIAHDYNNLMSAIMGNLSMAMEETEPGSLLADFLQKANNASYKVRDLTHELMALSSGGEPLKEVGSLKELLQSALGTIPVENGISVNESISKDLWQVPYDTYKMGSVFRNVVTNAVEAMPEGGALTITAENLRIEDKEQYPGLPVNPGDYVHISFQDQGVGIPKEHLDKIFDPYFSTKEMGVSKGMGLGLATAYAIVKSHGGHVAFDSSPDVGTTVNIYLPAQRQPLQYDGTNLAKNSKLLMKRVLVMDDEEMLRNLTEKMLERLGYTVETVEDGLKAVEVYKKQMDSSEPFDAVILDLTIKGGMGGEGTIFELRKIDPDVKAIVSSGYFNDPVMAHFERYGFKGALAKPYNKDDLERVLKEILG